MFLETWSFKRRDIIIGWSFRLIYCDGHTKKWFWYRSCCTRIARTRDQNRPQATMLLCRYKSSVDSSSWKQILRVLKWGPKWTLEIETMILILMINQFWAPRTRLPKWFCRVGSGCYCNKFLSALERILSASICSSGYSYALIDFVKSTGLAARKTTIRSSGSHFHRDVSWTHEVHFFLCCIVYLSSYVLFFPTVHTDTNIGPRNTPRVTRVYTIRVYCKHFELPCDMTPPQSGLD